MSDPTADEMIVGLHEFRFVPPRRVAFFLRGVLEDEHALACIKFGDTYSARSGRSLEALFDMTELTGITLAARKEIVRGEQKLQYRAVAFVGASFPIRTMATMVLRAGKIISPKKFSFAFAFVDSIELANAWLDEDADTRGGL